MHVVDALGSARAVGVECLHQRLEAPAVHRAPKARFLSLTDQAVAHPGTVHGSSKGSLEARLLTSIQQQHTAKPSQPYPPGNTTPKGGVELHLHTI